MTTNHRVGKISAAGMAVVALIVVTACGIRLPGSGEPPKLYDLTPKSTFSDDIPTVDWQLVIQVPIAPASLDTNRIALRRSPTTVEYFKGVSWIDRAPRLIQTLLVESFENSGKIVAVGREAVGLRADYVLKPDMREFQVEYGTENPQVRVRLNLKLVKMPERAIIASTTFEHTAPASGLGMHEIVIAFDSALGKVLKQVIEWTLVTPAGSS